MAEEISLGDLRVRSALYVWDIFGAGVESEREGFECVSLGERREGF